MFTQALLFLISTLFNLYLFVLILRFMLALARADYYHPLTQFVTRLTQPIVAPVRKYIRNVGNIELATLLWLYFITLIKMLVIFLLFGAIPNLILLLFFAFIAAIKLILLAFTIAIIVQAVMSWISHGYSPLQQTVNSIVDPLLRPIRRIVPLVAGVDISPLVALILLQFISILLSQF